MSAFSNVLEAEKTCHQVGNPLSHSVLSGLAGAWGNCNCKRALYFCQPAAVSGAVLRDRTHFFRSSSTIRLHVSFGLPQPLCPWDVQGWQLWVLNPSFMCLKHTMELWYLENKTLRSLSRAMVGQDQFQHNMQVDCVSAIAPVEHWHLQSDFLKCGL